MSYSPVFKSEVFVPIKKDNHLFEERQKNIWEDVHERMERRRREWEGEVERMRQDFFRLKPVSVGGGGGGGAITEGRRQSSENLLETMDLDRVFRDDVGEGKKFQVGFDVSQFEPEEINVRTEENKVIVHARHEEGGASGKSVSREFSRTVDIPDHVDPEKLTCTLSKDGILTLEAPVSAPQYNRILTNDVQPQQHPNLMAGPSLMSHAQLMHAQPPLMQQQTTVASPPALARQNFSTGSGPLVTEEDGARKMKFVVDIGAEFQPEDISVKTVDKKLQVTARHEERRQGRTSMREFSKEFELPEDVDPNTVVASMTNDGKLILEAPLQNSQPQQAPHKPHITISLR